MSESIYGRASLDSLYESWGEWIWVSLGCITRDLMVNGLNAMAFLGCFNKEPLKLAFLRWDW
jgi:hypothetical protein